MNVAPPVRLAARTEASLTDAPIGLSIVIPCYNEETSITRMVSELRPVLRELCATASPVEVVFVDDGSTDATWWRLTELADGQLPEARVRLRRHDTNRGLGAALRTGFSASGGSIIVTTDSDSTYSFSEIPALISRLTPDVAIVTASPYHPAGGVAGVPPSRLILSRGSSLIYRALVDRRVHTYTALFRAYRAEVVRRVGFESDGFLAVAELLVKAMLCGYRVAEYPTVLRARAAGTSKAKLVRTIAAHVGFQLKVLLWRLGFGPNPPGGAVVHGVAHRRSG
jgi:dolichol-phosphate mannosyltransferase